MMNTGEKRRVSKMKCPKCGSDDWVYTDNEREILELDDNGHAIQIDFPCFCTDCGCEFFRREVFVHSGERTEWIVDGEFIEGSE